MHYRQSSRDFRVVYDAGNVYARAGGAFAKHPPEHIVADFPYKSRPASELRKHRQKVARRAAGVGLEQ